MGTAEDRLLRESARRVDNEERKKKVKEARKLILRNNYAVGTDKVELLLKPTSLTPSKVRDSQKARTSPHTFDCRTLSRSAYLGWALTSTIFQPSTSCMKWRLAHGNPYSFTSFDC